MPDNSSFLSLIELMFYRLHSKKLRISHNMFLGHELSYFVGLIHIDYRILQDRL